MIHWADWFWLATCAVIGGVATFVGERIGYKRGVQDGRLQVSHTHAYDMGRKAGQKEGTAEAFDKGRKAGQRETADYLAASDIPVVKAAGEALRSEGWGS